MKPQIPRKHRLKWQESRLRRLLGVQKAGTITDKQMARLRALTVSVAQLRLSRRVS